ncbi:alpha/beta hydrolase [Microlunatus elymi]|uniref:Alpha/beta hydrolase n=1 Tax=Microlunatus elymi TaxID=2596828 RepID=A0A516Q199_9ACTN|nr:alpha/beta hydrolase [Microlunatus elymi]QDP97210.1 alpha/beta hydrolase [Microlunatus elymi]
MNEYDNRLVRPLQVVESGSPEASPLLLIHGSGAAGPCWDFMVPALARRHHVIQVDLPGCGKSPTASTYEVPHQAHRVADVLDDLGITTAAVGGHSSGGYVATALAEQRPDLVGSLTLINSGPSMAAELPPPLALRVLLGPPLGGLIWSFRSDSWIRNGLNATAAHPVQIPDEMIAGVSGTSYRTMRAILRCNAAYLNEHTVPQRLARLDLPILVILGDTDRKWSPDLSIEQYRTVSRARIEVLPDVGHVAILEAPERTADLLLEFVAASADAGEHDR